MAEAAKWAAPTAGEAISVKNGGIEVPDHPIVPFIEGDGTGPDIWAASRPVIDAAVQKAYGVKRRIAWHEIYAGQKPFDRWKEWLPEQTIESIAKYKVAIKGPLTTPVGGGIRSLNVTLRQRLDLYACVRPVRYYPGTPSPVKEPEKMDMVIFRENSEDVYMGIEWKAGTPQCLEVIDFLNTKMGCKIRTDSGIGIKPISAFGSKRLIRKAIQYAVANGRRTVTMVHKGNIMKFTSGAFRDWGYELAAQEFSDVVVSEKDLWDKHGGKLPAGKVLLNDRIADAMFQQILLRPDEYEVLATPNLNGDYISDAAAAQVGGLGIAPGGNLSDDVALFEATHGTAPKYAGQDKVNPGSVVLSGVMMLRHMGWAEAADLVEKGLAKTIANKTVTYDFERLMRGAKLLKCSEFGKAIVANM